jgi:hypothetical protein
MEENNLEVPLNNNGASSTKLAFIYDRIERWKDSYYHLTDNTLFGSIVCLLCLTFGSGLHY